MWAPVALTRGFVDPDEDPVLVGGPPSRRRSRRPPARRPRRSGGSARPTPAGPLPCPRGGSPARRCTPRGPRRAARPRPSGPPATSKLARLNSPRSTPARQVGRQQRARELGPQVQVELGRRTPSARYRVDDAAGRRSHRRHARPRPQPSEHQHASGATEDGAGHAATLPSGAGAALLQLRRRCLLSNIVEPRRVMAHPRLRRLQPSSWPAARSRGAPVIVAAASQAQAVYMTSTSPTYQSAQVRRRLCDARLARAPAVPRRCRDPTRLRGLPRDVEGGLGGGPRAAGPRAGRRARRGLCGPDRRAKPLACCASWSRRSGRRPG